MHTILMPHVITQLSKNIAVRNMMQAHARMWNPSHCSCAFCTLSSPYKPLPCQRSSVTSMGDVPEVPTTTVRDSGPLVMDKKLSYLDVRTPEEYANEHVVGSVNVPWFLDLKTRQVNPAFVEDTKKALGDADANIVVSCQMGRRGAMATKALQDAKFSNVVNLEGGLNSWVGAGLPTQK